MICLFFAFYLITLEFCTGETRPGCNSTPLLRCGDQNVSSVASLFNSVAAKQMHLSQISSTLGTGGDRLLGQFRNSLHGAICLVSAAGDPSHSETGAGAPLFLVYGSFCTGGNHVSVRNSNSLLHNIDSKFGKDDIVHLVASLPRNSSALSELVSWVQLHRSSARSLFIATEPDQQQLLQEFVKVISTSDSSHVGDNFDHSLSVIRLEVSKISFRWCFSDNLLETPVCRSADPRFDLKTRKSPPLAQQTIPWYWEMYMASQIAFDAGCGQLKYEPCFNQQSLLPLDSQEYKLAHWRWTAANRAFTVAEHGKTESPPRPFQSITWGKGLHFSKSEKANSSASVVIVWNFVNKAAVNPDRNEEMLQVLYWNLQSSAGVAWFLILVDCESDFHILARAVAHVVLLGAVTVQRVRAICVKLRPTFRDYFHVALAAEAALTGETPLTFILMNSDIFVLEDTVRKLQADQRLSENTAYAVTRHDVVDPNSRRASSLRKMGTVVASDDLQQFQNNGTRTQPLPGLISVNGTQFAIHEKDRPLSQDAWVLRSPLPPSLAAIGDYHLGLWGCDNRIAAELRSVGLRLENPYSRLFFGHVHVASQHLATEDRMVLHGKFARVDLTSR